MGGRGPDQHVFPPSGKAVSNHRIQETMNHSHQLSEMTDLRTETSRNSSFPGLQGICSPGPRLAPAFSSAALRAAGGHSSPASAVGAGGRLLARSPCAVPPVLWFQTPTPPMPPVPRPHPANTVPLLRASCCPRRQDMAGHGVFNALVLLERILFQWGRQKEKHRSPQT